jgi:hypothetical protein
MKHSQRVVRISLVLMSFVCAVTLGVVAQDITIRRQPETPAPRSMQLK